MTLIIVTILTGIVIQLRGTTTEEDPFTQALSVILITPHFLLSIWMFYLQKGRRFRNFDRAHHWAAWGFPVLYWSVLTCAALWPLHSVIPNFHRLTTALILWHFVKQSYGIALQQAYRRQYSFDPQLRNLLHYWFIWIAIHVWVGQNLDGSRVRYFGLAFSSLSLPLRLHQLSSTVLVALSSLLVAKAIRSHFRLNRDARIPREALITVLITAVWLLPMGSNPTLWLLIPGLHALQHLLFAVPISWRLSLRKPIPHISGALFFAVGLGLLHYGVKVLDQELPLLGGKVGIMGWQFSVATFMNLHHYFIEGALWAPGEGDIKQT